MRFVQDPCPTDQAFRFRDGRQARSLAEFRGAIAEAPAEVVQFHREHYQHWVRDILADPGLAQQVTEQGKRAPDGEVLRRNLLGLLDPYVRQQGSAAMPQEAHPAGRRR